MKTILHKSLLFLALLVSVHAETIDITDTKGRSFAADLVACDGKTIEICRKSDSKKFTLPLSSLDEKTNTSVKTWMKKGGNLSRTFEVAVNTGKTSRTTIGEDFDDKRVNLSPVVTVKNPNSSRKTAPLEITVLFFGRPVDSTTDIHVFRKQTFELPEIEPLGTKDFPVEAISKPFDNRGYAKFGARYLGYAWIIHDSSKKDIVASTSVPSTISSKHGETVLKLEAETTYTKDLIPVPGRSRMR